MKNKWGRCTYTHRRKYSRVPILVDVVAHAPQENPPSTCFRIRRYTRARFAKLHEFFRDKESQSVVPWMFIVMPFIATMHYQLVRCATSSRPDRHERGETRGETRSTLLRALCNSRRESRLGEFRGPLSRSRWCPRDNNAHSVTTANSAAHRNETRDVTTWRLQVNKWRRWYTVGERIR